MGDSQHNSTRREFATRAVGAMATALSGMSAGLAHAVPPAPPTVPRTDASAASVRRQSDLIRLSNMLFNRPARRQQFLADPTGFTRRMGMHGLLSRDIAQIDDMVSNGFCAGCGW